MVDTVHQVDVVGERRAEDVLKGIDPKSLALSMRFLEATIDGNVGDVDALLDEGAQIESRASGETALMLAAQEGHVDIARLLLDRGAILDARNNHGNSSLLLASREGREEMVRLLLDRGADIEAVEKEGWTALIMAAWNGEAGIVRVLLERGANVNARATDDEGSTALIRGAMAGSPEVLRLLIEHGADIDARNTSSCTALMCAVSIQSMQRNDAIRVLLSAGADLSLENSGRNRAIHHVLRMRELDVARMFFDHGEDPNGSMPDGKSYDEFLKDSPEFLALLQARRNVLAIEDVIRSSRPPMSGPEKIR
jgi:ankyrin repeat protein